MDMQNLKTFVINLKERADRKTHILAEFANRSEFDVSIVQAVKDSVGSWGLWMTITEIVETAQKNEDDFVIICENDHVFTNDYNKELLVHLIEKAKESKADLLLGGVSWFETVLPVSKNLFWVKKFNGLQFTVVFKTFYQRLLSFDLQKGQDVDVGISMHSDRCFVCYPYISMQKEFGYSDVTARNSEPGYVSGIFRSRMEKLRQLNQIASYYQKI